MKSIVCVKRVPDTEARLRISGDGASVDPAGALITSNPTGPPPGSAPCTRTAVAPSPEVTSAANACGATSACKGVPPIVEEIVTVDPGDAISPALSYVPEDTGVTGREPPFVICVPPTAGRLRRCRRPLDPAFPVSKLATGNGTVTLSPVESAIASVAPAAPSSPLNGSAGRKLRPAPPSHCVACGVALATLVSAPPPGRPTITVTELASAFVDTHSAGPAAVSMRTSRIAAEAEAGNAASAIASTASRGSRRRILSTYDMAQCVPARTIRPMQRAVAIALAGGLLAASAGAFALAQLLKLERSPIEAIRVDPTANHGRGLLDRHDSALFSPRCAAPCLRSAQVRFRVHTSGPVTAEILAPGGSVVRDLGRLPHRGGRVVVVWDGRGAGGAVAPDGSYRLRVDLSGRHIQLLNPLMLDTEVGILGTNVSRRVISPDCDSHGDRVTVVVRGREQLAGLRLQALQGARLIRTVRLKSRARSLAISWPPRVDRRCVTAPDGLYRLRVIARDVAGNARAIDVGDVRARGVALSPPARSIEAGRRIRVGISADARGLRLDLVRLGGTPTVLARRVHAPAGVARVPAATRGGVYDVSNRHAGRTSRALVAVRGGRPAHVALVVRGQPRTTLAAYQRRLDGLGIRFDALTPRDVGTGAAEGYNVVVVPPGGAAEGPITGVRLVTSLAGITAGLGS